MKFPAVERTGGLNVCVSALRPYPRYFWRPLLWRPFWSVPCPNRPTQIRPQAIPAEESMLPRRAHSRTSHHARCLYSPSATGVENAVEMRFCCGTRQKGSEGTADQVSAPMFGTGGDASIICRKRAATRISVAMISLLPGYVLGIANHPRCVVNLWMSCRSCEEPPRQSRRLEYSGQPQ